MMTRDEIRAIYDAGPEAVIVLVEQLLGAVATLTARVQHLENQLATRSHNSSKPPSSDGFAKQTKSRRQKSGKRPGGQPGHPGQSLRMVPDPQHTVRHSPTRCPCCDAELAAVPATVVERRQVFDLPLSPVEVTEHQVESKQCPRCGGTARGEFPAWVTQPVQYGPRLLALLVYLVVYQLLPWKRARELLQDLFGVEIGGGTLSAAVERCFCGLAATTAQIQAALRAAPCVGFDETGARIDGKLHWWHTASTPTLTHFSVHPKRGQDGIGAGGILPAFRGRAVHDAWSPYFGYDCAHALCNAHHLRELTYLVEREGQAWAAAMIALLVEAHDRVAAARAAGATALDPETQATIAARYRRLLVMGWEANPAPAPPAGASPAPKRGRPAQSRARNLLARLERYERETLAFVADFRVPFDNNQSERDLRMLKVQQKISGGFRSEEGAHWFGRIRGYLLTMRKQAQPMLAAIESVFQGHPTVPSLSA